MIDANLHAQFVRIAGETPRLIERSQASLARAEWGPQAKRPWVHFRDAHEAMEKGLWCYERGMVPLVTEADPALASALALRWSADLLLTDADSLRALAPLLPQHAELRVIVVIDAGLPADLEALAGGREVRRIAVA